ncbi:hypothetical protein ACHAWX_005547 [Stephanocyclus meneghinianus]
MAPSFSNATTPNYDDPSTITDDATPFPKIVTLGSSRALLQTDIVNHIICLLEHTSSPKVLYLASSRSKCKLTEVEHYKTCVSAFLESKCQVKCHNLIYGTIQEDIEDLLKKWADVVVCDWTEEFNMHEIIRK